MPIQSTCQNCGYIASSELCKACIMLDGLNRGRPELSIGKNNKRKKILKMTAGKAKEAGMNDKLNGSANTIHNTILQDVENMF